MLYGEIYFPLVEIVECNVNGIMIRIVKDIKWMGLRKMGIIEMVRMDMVEYKRDIWVVVSMHDYIHCAYKVEK